MPRRRRPRRLVLLAATAVALTALALPAPGAAAALSERPAAGSGPAAPSSPRRVVVVWEPGVARDERAGARGEADTAFVRTLGDRRFQLLRPRRGQSVAGALAALRDDPTVRTAVRETYDVLHATTNDPLFGQQWGLQNVGLGVGGFSGALAGADVDALAAWDRTRGAPSVVVADLDSGYRFDDPDLGPVAWSNPADPPNGADDDGNGIVDDAHGADFVGASANAPAVDGDPTDDNLIDGGHGVHTAGTIGAAGNNGAGISGVAQDVRIMPLRVCGYFADSDPSDGDDSGTVCPSSAQIQAINYAGAHGARVANMSLGGVTFNAAVRDAFAANPGVLFVISAGNDGLDNDAVPHFPCDYEPQTAGVAGAVDNVICVAATDQADRLAGFSDFGARSVDLGAPGTQILSTYPAIDALADDDFEANDFFASWTVSASGFGRARAGDGPLTSFGITDTPAATPLASARYQVELTTAVALPAGAGACVLSGRRFVSLGADGSFTYAIVPDTGAPLGFSPASTSGSTMASFATIPVTGLGGRSLRLRFAFTAPSVPSPANGVWLDDLLLECYAPLSVAPVHALLDGTSMAAPHVSGAAGLLVSMNPSATTEQVRAALLATAEPVPSLAGRTATGGRVDAASALDEIRAPDTSLLSRPSRRTRSRRAVFGFAGSDPALPAAFQCQLDGGAFAPCASPAAYTVRGGRHTFAVRATSPRGIVVDATPAAAAWTVTQCKVPRLKGKTPRRARRALRKAHCRLGKVRKPRRARHRRHGRRGRRGVVLVVKSSRPRAGVVRRHGAKVSVRLKAKARARRRRARR